MEDRRIPFCSIVALDTSTLCYRVCRNCEALVPESAPTSYPCTSCRPRVSGHGTKMLYRLQMSIATDDQVFPVVAFDRAAQKLMGRPADDFFHFSSFHPFTAQNVSKILKGEMVELSLRPPKSGRAQHMRVISLVPLSPDFEPVMHVLPKLYPKETLNRSS